MFDRMEFLVGEALVAMRRNFLMTFAAISTAAVALFLLGGLAYVYLRVNQFAKDVSGKFEMRVWLKDEIEAKQIPDLIAKIRKVPGVKTAIWVPKEKEWTKFQAEEPDQATIGVKNPIPESFKVILTELSLAPDVKDKLESFS
jgi:cell division transport system permease protein